MTSAEILDRFETMLEAYLLGGGESGLVDADTVSGKLYEAWVLAVIVEHLVVDEGCTLRLSRGSKIHLKSSPGPINRHYPHIVVYRSGSHVADIWTDIEFTTFSCTTRGVVPSAPGDFHELDIAVVEPSCDPRPKPEHIWLAAECKHRAYGKSFLRELLGLRRELGLLASDQSTRFRSWPRTRIPANPPVCLVAYSSDPEVLSFSAPGATYGIDFVHEPLT